MLKSNTLREIQPYELRRGIEELVRDAKPDFNNDEVADRTSWIYSLAMGAARKEAIASLLEYRDKSLDIIGLVKEKHQSKRLGKHLNAAGSQKPASSYEAHAIVSGKHFDARVARLLLAKYRIRVDGPDNGVWLPNFKKNVPHPIHPKAPAHRTLHTERYYINVTTLLSSTSTHVEARKTMKKIGVRLQQGRFPFRNEESVDMERW